MWGRQFNCCAVYSNELALDAQKYIERLPLAEKLVTHPGEYPWSSYCKNAFGGSRGILSRHQAFSSFLAGKQRSGPEAYREFVLRPFNAAYESFLEHRLLSGRALGRATRFRAASNVADFI